MRAMTLQLLNQWRWKQLRKQSSNNAALLRDHRALEQSQKPLLRRILADFIWTATLRHRIGKLPAATCPHCNGVEKTLQQMWWECPAWSSKRLLHPEAMHAYSSDWPACLKHCGICPGDCSAPVAAVQRLMVDILEARHAAEAFASPARTVARQRIHAAPRSSGEPHLQPASVAAPGVKDPKH